jgi:hypothetical protein
MKALEITISSDFDDNFVEDQFMNLIQVFQQTAVSFMIQMAFKKIEFFSNPMERFFW